MLNKNCHKRGKHNICPMCKLSYTSWPRIRAHIREQHNNTCDSCKTVYSNVGNLITHLTKDKNVCQKRKKRNQDYNYRVYLCNECKKEFHKQRQLIDHNKKYHNSTLVEPTNYTERANNTIQNISSNLHVTQTKKLHIAQAKNCT